MAFVAFTAVIAVFRYREMQHDKTFGATTVVAGMLAFALGALAVMGDMTAAAAAGVAVAMLLALKGALHAWLKRLTWEELRAGLILAAMTVIMLPLLPDRDLAYWLPVNPREVWLLTIMIAALSFAGYVAIRAAGPSLGVLLSAVAGRARLLDGRHAQHGAARPRAPAAPASCSRRRSCSPAPS